MLVPCSLGWFALLCRCSPPAPTAIARPVPRHALVSAIGCPKTSFFSLLCTPETSTSYCCCCCCCCYCWRTAHLLSVSLYLVVRPSCLRDLIWVLGSTIHAPAPTLPTICLCSYSTHAPCLSPLRPPLLYLPSVMYALCHICPLLLPPSAPAPNPSRLGARHSRLAVANAGGSIGR
jgi:hypothetical protein